MSSNNESQVVSVLSLLAFAEESSKCPLGVFATDLKSLLESLGEDVSLGDALAERSLALTKEEEELSAQRELSTIACDKLRAELSRVESQLAEQQRRLEDVRQQKMLCKAALNSVVAGQVPLYRADGQEPMTARSMSRAKPHARGDDDEGHNQPASAPEPTPSKKPVSSTTPSEKRPGSTASSAPRSGSSSEPAAHTSALDSPRRSTGTSLLTLLRLPDVKEAALQQAVDSYEQQTFSSDSWMGPEPPHDFVDTLLALARHLPEPRPPVQLSELRILGRVLQAPNVDDASNRRIAAIISTLVDDGAITTNLTKLLNSVNDDVKCEALECLSPLVCLSHSLLNACGSQAVCSAVRRGFLQLKGIEPLVNIVVCSTSEAVLERALVFLWGLLAKDEKTDAQNNDGKAIRAQVRELGGLRAVLDLLYTDSLAILENVCMVIGYITREDASKTEIREVGGLEKITATLRHPSDSIKTKMAGAVWNCASNPENRAYLRQLGTIPVLLELLGGSPSSTSSSANAEADAGHEFVRENAAGALWNLSVDPDNKKQLLEYGGIPILVSVMGTSRSVAVVENVSGTLWNCSAAVESRPAIRKAGGIPVLLSILDAFDEEGGRETSEKILDNVAGTLRNCAINDLNKPVIQQSGGVELIVKRLDEALLHKPVSSAGARRQLSHSTIDKLAASLWILTISPEIKQSLRTSGAIETITNILLSSSPTLSGRSTNNKGKQGGTAVTSSSVFPAPTAAAGNTRPKTAAEFRERFFSPALLESIPAAQPPCTIHMSTKEKLVGILRNCSTIPENRKTMVTAGAVSAIVSVVLDCYSKLTVFQASGGGSSHKASSRLAEPSAQLKETAASALWYLSREDKTGPREQGGLELMCMFLLTPSQPPVVLEQAAGTLSSLTVSNAENRDLIRERGGLRAALDLIMERARTEYPDSKSEKGKEQASQTVSVLNALLTVRNSLVNNDENLRVCAEEVTSKRSTLPQTIVYLLEHASDECAREGALTLKNICASTAAQDVFLKHNAEPNLNQMLERATSDSMRRAATSALAALGVKKSGV